MPTSFYVTNKNKARLGHNGIQDIMLSYILCLLGGIVIGAMAGKFRGFGPLATAKSVR